MGLATIWVTKTCFISNTNPLTKALCSCQGNIRLILAHFLISVSKYFPICSSKDKFKDLDKNFF